MSGPKVVPFLEQTNDVYVTGGSVVRHKVVDGVEKLVFLPGSTTELLLSARNLYKLRQRDTPAPPKATAGSGDVSQPSPQPPPVQPKPVVVWRHSLRLIRCVVPLMDHPYHHHHGPAPAGQPQKFYGFAIQFFTAAKGAVLKPKAKQTSYMRYAEDTACGCVQEGFCLEGNIQLRVREYAVGVMRPSSGEMVANADSDGVGSAYLQEDWCLSFRVTQMNFWHEVLEDSIIPPPEIFQYQLYVMNLKKASGAARPLLAQVVLSTEKLYIVPRHSPALLEAESAAQVKDQQMEISQLEQILIDRVKGTVEIKGPSSGSPGVQVDAVLGCFEVREVVELVLEVQRIWELSHKGDNFPFMEV